MTDFQEGSNDQTPLKDKHNEVLANWGALYNYLTGLVPPNYEPADTIENTMMGTLVASRGVLGAISKACELRQVNLEDRPGLNHLIELFDRQYMAVNKNPMTFGIEIMGLLFDREAFFRQIRDKVHYGTSEYVYGFPLAQESETRKAIGKNMGIIRKGLVHMFEEGAEALEDFRDRVSLKNTVYFNYLLGKQRDFKMEASKRFNNFKGTFARNFPPLS